MSGPAARFARGKRAWGLCDRCGFRYLLNQLRPEIFDRRPNGLRVCPSCFDKDHPQLRLGEVNISDPQALRDPRPDLGRVSSTQLFGWRPVGHQLTNQLTVAQGSVTVTVS